MLPVNTPRLYDPQQVTPITPALTLQNMANQNQIQQQQMVTNQQIQQENTLKLNEMNRSNWEQDTLIQLAQKQARNNAANRTQPASAATTGTPMDETLPNGQPAYTAGTGPGTGGPDDNNNATPTPATPTPVAGTTPAAPATSRATASPSSYSSDAGVLSGNSIPHIDYTLLADEANAAGVRPQTILTLQRNVTDQIHNSLLNTQAFRDQQNAENDQIAKGVQYLQSIPPETDASGKITGYAARLAAGQAMGKRLVDGGWMKPNDTRLNLSKLDDGTLNSELTYLLGQGGINDLATKRFQMQKAGQDLQVGRVEAASKLARTVPLDASGLPVLDSAYVNGQPTQSAAVQSLRQTFPEVSMPTTAAGWKALNYSQVPYDKIPEMEMKFKELQWMDDPANLAAFKDPTNTANIVAQAIPPDTYPGVYRSTFGKVGTDISLGKFDLIEPDIKAGVQAAFEINKTTDPSVLKADARKAALVAAAGEGAREKMQLEDTAWRAANTDVNKSQLEHITATAAYNNLVGLVNQARTGNGVASNYLTAQLQQSLGKLMDLSRNNPQLQALIPGNLEDMGKGLGQHLLGTGNKYDNNVLNQMLQTGGQFRDAADQKFDAEVDAAERTVGKNQPSFRNDMHISRTYVPPIPATVTKSDIGKVYRNAKTGEKVRIISVNAQGFYQKEVIP